MGKHVSDVYAESYIVINSSNGFTDSTSSHLNQKEMLVPVDVKVHDWGRLKCHILTSAC